MTLPRRASAVMGERPILFNSVDSKCKERQWFEAWVPRFDPALQGVFTGAFVSWHSSDTFRHVLLYGQGRGLPPQLDVTCTGDTYLRKVKCPTQADVQHALRWLVGLEEEPTREVGRG